LWLVVGGGGGGGGGAEAQTRGRSSASRVYVNLLFTTNLSCTFMVPPTEYEANARSETGGPRTKGGGKRQAPCELRATYDRRGTGYNKRGDSVKRKRRER